MDEELLKAVRELVKDLAHGHYDEMVADGRAGRLTAMEIQRAVCEYGRTLQSLPDQAVPLIDLYVSELDQRVCSLDVPMWTAEEGRSDLTLSLVAIKCIDGYKLKIADLRVL